MANLHLPPLTAEQRSKLRLVLHWTGGNYSEAGDLASYHFVHDGDGKVHAGVDIMRNIGGTHPGYAAHTRGMNTNSIGISACGMWGSSPDQCELGDYGPYPLTKASIESLIETAAEICQTYGIPVIPTRVLMHSEVTKIKGIVQHGKWDLNFIPHLDMRDREYEDGTRRTGNYFRASIRDRIAGLAPQPIDHADTMEVQAAERQIFDHFIGIYDLAQATGASANFMAKLNELRKLKPLAGQKR